MRMKAQKRYMYTVHIHDIGWENKRTNTAVHCKRKTTATPKHSGGAGYQDLMIFIPHIFPY